MKCHGILPDRKGRGKGYTPGIMLRIIQSFTMRSKVKGEGKSTQSRTTVAIDTTSRTMMITTTRVWVRIGTRVGMDGIEGVQGQTTTTVVKVKCLTEIETGLEVGDAHTNSRTIRTNQTTPCLRRLTRSAWRRGSLQWAPLSWPPVTPRPGVNPPENPTVSCQCCPPTCFSFYFLMLSVMTDGYFLSFVLLLLIFHY